MSASLVRGRGYDAPRPQAPDDNGHPKQRRITPPLDLDVERIHVDVEEPFGESASRRLDHATTLVGMRTIRIHLVRHGEVLNPDHVVYAGLPGFGLSERGRAQAAAAGRYLARQAVGTIVTSPLRRARETAEIIGSELSLEAQTDPRLTEWGVVSSWAGLRWDDLPTLRPGMVEAYLDHPDDLDFTPETLEELAQRMSEAIGDLSKAEKGEVAVVSHQDSVHAARRYLSGQGFADFSLGKPGHCGVVTLEHSDNGWEVVAEWEPSQGGAFPPGQ